MSANSRSTVPITHRSGRFLPAEPDELVRADHPTAAVVQRINAPPPKAIVIPAPNAAGICSDSPFYLRAALQLDLAQLLLGRDEVIASVAPGIAPDLPGTSPLRQHSTLSTPRIAAECSRGYTVLA